MRMSRGLGRRLKNGAAMMAVAAIFAGFAALAPVSALEKSETLQRFLALEDPDPTQYRALRHLEARNDQFGKSATMDVWTEGDADGFRYQIVSEQGSEYIRNHVFRQTLDTEQKMWGEGTPATAALTPANYVFSENGPQPDGSASLLMKPRRKDMLLVDGAIFLSPEDGDLIRMEGTLSKTPSFWTRHVRITRWYKRFAGVRMPVALDSTANVRVAGQSSFRMTYQYESVNGQRF
jgi:hypothetical protein